MENLYKLKSIAINIVIVLISVFWIALSLFTLEPTNVNPLTLVIEAALSIVIGVIIKTLFVKDGLVQGYRTDLWNDQIKKYNASCNTVVQYMDRANNFKICQKIELTEEYRREVLTKEKLKYDMWFNKYGEYDPQAEIISVKKINKMLANKEEVKGLIGLTKKQRKVLKKCIEVKVKPLDIFSERSDDIIKKATKGEQTDRAYEKEALIKNILVAVLVALIAVYFIPNFLDKVNWGKVIYSCVQIVIWIAFGIIQKYNSIDFVRHIKVNVLREKQVLIQQFKEGCEHGKYKDNPYHIKEEENEAILD